ncbi:MAG: shikimate dehydrogenase [Actinobacteria bacterium]|nr:MAG: shikimate dehydrogenase [Actinomycetota bacterium]TMK92663.1 MAG: shikimate dehydrogenase [Actinomycetota bacterium]TMM21809.1 MAG: shikimate dehydrogenase [Actinomycetota bacterium]
MTTMRGGSRIRGGTRTVGIIGWPVSHSLSPAIHNAAFAALDLDWAYVPLPVAPGDAVGAVAGLRTLGFAGANVTMPHKSDVADVVDTLSEDARRLHAVNTVLIGEDGMTGHNTDTPGFDRFLRRDAGFDPAGRSALIFGAGGAGRACALALARAAASRITIVARDPVSTADLRQALDGLSSELVVSAFEDAAATPADLVVNATPLGADGEQLPLPPIDDSTLVIDLLYHPAITPMQTTARESGAAVFGGLGLLLHQAALSFELWTGHPAPLEVMSAAAVASIAERS